MPARPLLGVEGSSSPARAMALIVGGVSLFSISDIAAKRLSADLPSMEVTWLRYAFLSGVAIAFALRGGPGVFASRQPGLQLFRGLALLGSASFFLLGLGRLGVAE